MYFYGRHHFACNKSISLERPKRTAEQALVDGGTTAARVLSPTVYTEERQEHGSPSFGITGNSRTL